MSQTDMILEHLKQGKSIAPLEAFQLYGCLRLAARVNNLRDVGYRIETTTRRNGRKRWAEYTLAEQ